MRQRDTLKMIGSTIGIVATADLLGLASVATETRAPPGSVRVRRGAHVGMWIFRTIPSEQGALIESLHRVLREQRFRLPPLALMRSVDRHCRANPPNIIRVSKPTKVFQTSVSKATKLL
jgi:hypothetical protein